ncbi:MAG TPA: S-layer homology domain-containing protein [Bacillota bacterium]|nr:S-layer homology domain-containing protein [Bacillota bacterium]
MDYGFRDKLKKALIGIIAVALIIGSGLNSFADDGPKTYTFSGGEGTEKSPYLISGLDDLIAISDAFLDNNNIRDAHFKLTADIDLGETVWNPIGNPTISFSGVFDGNGKRITVKNIADGSMLGVFGIADSQSNIRNLIVRGAINKTINSKEEVYFGLVAGWAEGIIENCITEGSVALTVETPEEFCFGGVIGFGRGSFSHIQNNASLNLIKSGHGNTSLGGIAGSMRGQVTPLTNITNTGTIDANADGRILTGGIIGEYGFGPNIYNALNQGNISVVVKKIDSLKVAAGGITGEIRESGIDRALNKGKVKISYIGSSSTGEIIAGGITGIGEYCRIYNAGNEGSVEASENKVLYAAGIAGNVGKEVSIANAYNKGNIYGISPDKNAELYVEGSTGGVTVVDNFYNSGSVRMKAGNMREVDGEAFTNIRPGENTKTFNYCYWASGILPFPLTRKEQATTSSFNPGNGKLSRNVNIGGKQYDHIKDALNAWTATQQNEYLKWSGSNTPSFEVSFGYSVPEYMTYRNQREGKWLNASDWAYEWMDKADRLGIIPEILINVDMTKRITRREFSALAVKLYEKLSGKAAIADGNSPFRDTEDQFIIKAYSLGIVSGVGNGLFAPDDILTREQASVVLTRVYKAVYLEGWAFEENEAYTHHSLDIDGVARFSDDYFISSWARESVYFMAKHDIINGVGSNMFGPRYREGEKEGFGVATREQAFKIAVAMIERFM